MPDATYRSLRDLKRAVQTFESSREAMLETLLLLIRFRHLYGLPRVPVPEPPLAPSSPRIPAWNRLSPRELEVLRKVVEGKSTRQIAADLGIAFKTAACHRAKLMVKLNVHETASLVRRAIELGFV
jgi:DNA-binding NarL/FixJ family response regulator